MMIYRKMKNAWKGLDKNKLAHQIFALLIGIGLGLYAYESKIALVPMKWQLDSRVAHSIAQQAGTPGNTRTAEPSDLGQPWHKSPLVQRFWDATGASRYVNHLSQYTRTMENWGIRGGLKEQMDDLMKGGVEVIPQKWRSPERLPFVLLGLILVAGALVAKILMYLSLLDFRRPSKDWLRPQPKSKTAIQWNAIVQDICMLGLSAMGGIYLRPAIEEFLKGEPPSYPYPLAGSLIMLGLLVMYLSIASSFIDCNAFAKGGRLVSGNRFRKFSQTYNWNDFCHAICALILGVGLGFYAYESNLALIPLQWQTDRKVAQEVERQAAPNPSSSFWEDLTGIFQKTPIVGQQLDQFWKATKIDRYMRNFEKYARVHEHLGIRGKLKSKMENLMREGVSAIPKKWQEPRNMPYFLAGLIVVLASLVLKILLYLRMVDVNQWVHSRKFTLLKRSRAPIPWNQMSQEGASLLLSATVGMYVQPFLDALAGEAASYPYPRIGPLVILACLALKFWLTFGSFAKRKATSPTAPGPRVQPRKKFFPKRRF